MAMDIDIREKNLSSPSRSGLLASLVLLITFIGASTAFGTQPPPPTQYTLTVNRQGGADCTQIMIEAPDDTDPSSTPIERTYTSGTWIEVSWYIECPCCYIMTHWESNDPEIDQLPAHHMADFTINEDTIATAVFVPVTPVVVDFAKSSMDMDEYGTLTVVYTWGSSSGDPADLAGQDIIEVLAYDLSVTFEDVLAFLCTGKQSTDEKITLPAPWNEWGQLPKITRVGAGAPAENAACPDTHTRVTRPTGCTSQCSYTTKQWYVVQRGACWYLADGPYDITRYYFLVSGEEWYYCIEKHEETKCVATP